MLFLFRKTTIAFWIIMPLIIIITVTYMLPFPYSNELGERAYYYCAFGTYVAVPDYGAAMSYTYAFMLGSILLSFIVIELTARQKHKKLLGILISDCDPQRFIASYHSNIRGLDRQRSRLSPNALVVNYNYALGLFECGDIENAVTVLSDLTKRREIKDKVNVNAKALAYIHLLRLYYVDGNKKGTEQIHKSINVIAEDYSSSRHTRFNKLVPDVVSSANAMRDYYQENYSMVLDYYKKQLNKAKSNYDCACVQGVVAVIYDSLREDSLAKENLNGAIGLGGGLFSVEVCRERLSIGQ